MFDLAEEQTRLGRWAVPRPAPDEGGNDGGKILLHNVLHDIEMYEPKSASSRGSVFDTVFKKGELARSGVLVRQLIDAPQRCVKFLEGRQRTLQGIPRDALESSMAACKMYEEDVVWVRENHGADIHDLAFFTSWYTKRMNASPMCLATMNTYRIFASPAIGILSPLMYFIVPYLVIRYKTGFKLKLSTYLRMMFNIVGVGLRGGESEGIKQKLTKYASMGISIVMYFQGIFSNLEVSKMLRGVCGEISTRLKNLSEFSKHVHAAWAAVDVDSIDRYLFRSGPVTDGELHIDSLRLCSKRGACVADIAERVVRQFGGNLREYRRLSKDVLGDLLLRAYTLDAILAMLRAKDLTRSTFVNFVPRTDADARPVLALRKVWFPMISAEAAVHNDWNIRTNIILTGPNAGGKSTIMKAVLLSALMAQTLTFAPCTEGMDISPFSVISSHINVADNQAGDESLFEAEMMRAKNNLTVLGALKKDECGLVVMDEIFSSTNPIEGISGAYATAKKLGTFRNAISIVSTHFVYLTRLGRGRGGDRTYRNYKMPVSLTARAPGSGSGSVGAVSAPYVLQKGVSTQYVALEIMKQSGYDTELIDDAIQVRDSLLSGAV